MTTITSRLRSINPVQLGLVLGVIYAIFGFIAALFLLFFGNLASFGAGSYFMFARAGVLSVVVLPVIYFIAGFIGGALTAAIYNLVARWTGGVEITLDTTPG